MKAQRSKSGRPTLTENGGGATNTGSAMLIADATGKSVKPLFIPRGYSNGDHAVFVIQPGMTIITAWRDRGGESGMVERIVTIAPEGDSDNANEITTELVGEYENGDDNLPSSFQDGIQCALDKAHCYHCREPHFTDLAQ